MIPETPKIPDVPKVPDYDKSAVTFREEWDHSYVTIPLATLIQENFFKPDDTAWKFTPKVFYKRDEHGRVVLGSDGYPTYDDNRNEELRKRLVKKFIARHKWDEISCVPPARWRDYYVSLTQECVDNLAYLWRFNDDVEVGNVGDTWGKKRSINSEFPASLLNGRTEDYASTGVDGEWEIMNRDISNRDKIDLYMKHQNPDDIWLNQTDSLFCAIYSLNINGMW